MVALVLLPQILLCGFFVSVDDLPNWIAWAHWLMPLTYVFRLFITEEFSTCLDFTIDEQYTMNCIRSIDNALGTIESLGALYNDTSVLRLFQTGTYTGPEAIQEYIALFSGGQDPLSPYWNTCPVSTCLVLYLW
jgi:hypothetical protein